MSFLLAVALMGAVTVDLSTGPTGSQGAWAKPAITCTAGETYSTAIDWGDGGQFWWYPSCCYTFHTYSGLGRTFNVTAIVKCWDRFGKVLPDASFTKVVTVPRRLSVTLIPGHGTLTVDIFGGLPPFSVRINGQQMTVGGSFSLPGALGGYMVTVSGATSSPDAPGITWRSPDQAGATANVYP